MSSSLLFVLSQLLFYFVKARINSRHQSFMLIGGYEILSLLYTYSKFDLGYILPS